jgi:hypothetical protein
MGRFTGVDAAEVELALRAAAHVLLADEAELPAHAFDDAFHSEHPLAFCGLADV